MWITLDLDNTLMNNPYWHLFLRPWLAVEAKRQGTDPLVLYEALNREGEARWRRGRWVESFDWPDMAKAIGLSPLPDPPAPDPAAVRPLIKDGAVALLHALRHSGASLALVTNGFSRFQTPYLQALGWTDLFHRIITPDVVGYAKPDPRMLEHCDPGLVHIGDRLTHDVLLALRTHRRAIWIAPDPPAVERDRIDRLMPAHIRADFRVPSLAACVPLMDRLFRERTFRL
jgi:FMN phosphatase YigB (HAD superfamily)